MFPCRECKRRTRRSVCIWRSECAGRAFERRWCGGYRWKGGFEKVSDVTSREADRDGVLKPTGKPTEPETPSLLALPIGFSEEKC